MLIVLVIVQVRYFQSFWPMKQGALCRTPVPRPTLPAATHPRKKRTLALSSPPPQRTKTIVWGRALVLSLWLFSVWARAPKACGVMSPAARSNCQICCHPLACEVK